MEEKELYNDQELVRRGKLAKYEELNIDPFGQAFKVSHHAEEIKKLLDLIGCTQFLCQRRIDSAVRNVKV